MPPRAPDVSPRFRRTVPRAGRPRSSPVWLPERLSGTVLFLTRTEVLAGVTMSAAVVAALLWANVAPHGAYTRVWDTRLAAGGLGDAGLTSLRQWVNGGLMTVFFLEVGLEVGRERACGALQDDRTAILPVVAAAGGMLGAAGAFLLATFLAGAGSAVTGGWGVPMATDVAFTLSAMALLGTRVPPALRVFVLALAVADDVGSVVVLAFVGSGRLHPLYLVALGALLVAVAMLRRRVRATWVPYAVAAVASWYLLARAGIEPTLGGAAVGILTPCTMAGGDGGTPPVAGGKRAGRRPRQPAAVRMEGAVAVGSALVVLPLFALANTGITLSLHALTAGTGGRVLAGIVVARLVGKMGGIVAATALVVRLGVVRLPEGVGWANLSGAALMCGMGFTVPLLFAAAAFAGSPALVDSAQMGLLVGTVLAAGCGAGVLWVAARAHAPATPTGQDTPVPPSPQ